MTRIKTTTVKENESLKLMSERYYAEAQRLEIHIGHLKDEIKSKPEPEKLDQLEKRLSTLRAEYRDLISTATQLSKLAAPPPIHPSLLRRERDAS